jgi:hypothetical protein
MVQMPGWLKPLAIAVAVLIVSILLVGIISTPYAQKGPAVPPRDMLAIAWVFCGLPSAVWIAFHEPKFLPAQVWVIRLAWPLLAIMLGPFGVPFYVLAYRRPVIQRGQMIVWDRPLWLQAMVATATSVAFGGLIMVVTGYLVTVYAMPLMPMHAQLFGLGMPMILVMIISFVVAVLISWPLYQTPMMAMNEGVSYRTALPRTLPIVLLSMTVAALGMDPSMWYFMTSGLPMMPTKESIVWFGTMFFAVFVAFMVAWPFNYLFVRQKWKSGVM